MAAKPVDYSYALVDYENGLGSRIEVLKTLPWYFTTQEKRAIIDSPLKLRY